MGLALLRVCKRNACFVDCMLSFKKNIDKNKSNRERMEWMVVTLELPRARHDVSPVGSSYLFNPQGKKCKNTLGSGKVTKT